jgi:hypothetical protein
LPVKRVQIPKPGGGMRELGIPTVTDRLIRRYLEAGIMAGGVVVERYEGTLQGGPISPLLAKRRRPGASSWATNCGAVQATGCAVSVKALATFKQRIREMTRRSGGRSLPEVVERLRTYVPGWKGYFQFAQTPKVFRELDEWPRHRLRALQRKHWKRGTTMYRGLLALGASGTGARRIAGNSCRWWHNSRRALNRVMPIAYFDRLDVPWLS